MRSHGYISFFIVTAIVLFCASCTPSDPRTELTESHKLMQKKQFDNALPGTRHCLDMDQENVDAIVANALCVYNVSKRDTQECKNARLNLSRATSTLAPERFDAWYAYTWILMQEEDYSNALKAARRARSLYRSQQKKSIPNEENCDKWDAELAKNSMPYANLLLMIADICRHNELSQGLAFCGVVISLPSFSELPEVYLIYTQLLMNEQNAEEAFMVISNATKKFSDNLTCAYNCALVDEYRKSRRGPMSSKDRKKLIYKFERAKYLASQYGENALASRIDHKIAFLSRQL